MMMVVSGSSGATAIFFGLVASPWPPLKIESVLCAYAPGREFVVVEVETKRGNRPIAFYIGAPVDEAGLSAAVAEKLADFKLPRRFIRIDELPTASGANGGKIQRSRMRALAAAYLSDEPDLRRGRASG